MVKPRAAGSRGFLAGTLILSAAAAAVKVFGFVYKIPVQNLLGPSASGYFAAAYDVFAALFVLSTAGLPVAVSALVSEARAVGDARQTARTLRVSLAVFCVPGILGTLALCLGADAIAAAGRSPQIASALRAVGPSMLLICVTGAFRGYHQGHGDMAPTAVSQT
ncbi:MAG: oligosaccharide flippase family protein, partial [Oscillospiraceae bacterium]|nr:oligosaccharide flippase family protein [Oscillospiraceae bacterium]